MNALTPVGSLTLWLVARDDVRRNPTNQSAQQSLIVYERELRMDIQHVISTNGLVDYFLDKARSIHLERLGRELAEDTEDALRRLWRKELEL